MQKKKSPKITFGATAFAGSNMIAASFKEFFSLFPAVTIEIQEANSKLCIEMIRSHKIDLGIVSIPAPELPYNDINWIAMERSELLVEVPIYHSLAQQSLDVPINARTVDLHALANTPLILPVKGSLSRQLLDNLFLAHDVTPTIVYETSNINLLHILAQNGIGISFLPSHNLEHWQTEKTLTLRLRPEAHIYNGIGYSHEKVLSESEKTLIALILRSRESHPEVIPIRNELTEAILKEVRQKDYGH